MLFYVVYAIFPCYSQRGTTGEICGGDSSEGVMATLEWT